MPLTRRVPKDPFFISFLSLPLRAGLRSGAGGESADGRRPQKHPRSGTVVGGLFGRSQEMRKAPLPAEVDRKALLFAIAAVSSSPETIVAAEKRLKVLSLPRSETPLCNYPAEANAAESVLRRSLIRISLYNMISRYML